MEIKNVILIGSGNVAWHLALAFLKAGIQVDHVAGRNIETVRELAQVNNIASNGGLDTLPETDGIYLIAVHDSAIAEVAEKIYRPGRKLVHCAGGVSAEVLRNSDNIYGVFYPILSFNKHVEADIASAVICVDSNNAEFTQALTELGKKLSAHTYHLTDEQRLVFNMGAVWSNNFMNHMFAITEEIMEKHGLQFHMLLPLIENSIEKIKQHSPSETQTGPAKRGEEAVLKKHLELLQDEPELASIYRLLSHSIKNKYLKS